MTPLPAHLAVLALVTVLLLARGAVCEQSTLSTPTHFFNQWRGLPVKHISFEGVGEERLKFLDGHLAQSIGAPLLAEDVAASLRALYATGLYDTIEVLGERDADGVDIIFRGTPREFIGTVTVTGARGATMNTQLERATRLNAGTRFTAAKMATAQNQMRQVLAENGYHEPAITYDLKTHPEQQLTDIDIRVVSGPRARIGLVQVTGDSGLSVDEFRRHAHLRLGTAVDRDTVARALSGVLKYYRSQKRLEAEIKLESQSYAAQKVTYRFTANRGPVVRVMVTGANLAEDRLKRLVPIFEEGTVDDDLLNEGNRRVRDYFQSLGYFDVKVDHNQDRSQASQVLITYNVQLGQRRRVERVRVEGNHYFDSDTLEDMLSVHAANALDRHGSYSQALLSADVAALTGVYQNNGFSDVKIAPDVAYASSKTTGRGTADDGLAPMNVTYRIDEGHQQRVGSVRLDGNVHLDNNHLLSLLNTEAGQLFSPRNLAGDRDVLTTEYMARGFEQAKVDVIQQSDSTDPSKEDVTFRISEGPQLFVRNVFLTGLHYTRPDTVRNAITIHPDDPLSQTAIEESQRNLYEFALFNEVNTAIENPGGNEPFKTVLIQTTEARRYTLTYGAGFEVQTGTPVNNCQGYHAPGANCKPNGRTGISARGLMALTRNNLFGREQSASIQGNYGSLEQRVDVLYQNPHFFGSRNLGLTFTGGYANSLAVTTYVAARLEAGFRLTQTFHQPNSALSRANTFIYGYDFRRVKVAESSLQVFPDFVSVLAAAVRVGGPSFTWVRDTRDSAVDAHRGTYTSFQEFLSANPFGAEAQFNRIDVSNSSFYGFAKGKFVLARNTRYGQERAFGKGSEELLPLPERLYAGGATSFRAFGTNAAGPRDPYTGFPIGGAGALVNNIELRLPPPTLPYFGNAVSFVLFHDMGNVFNNAGDIWESALRVQQPNRDACKTLKPLDSKGEPPPDGPTTSTGPHGTCSFDYFNHAPGVGVRYHTPVGPIRLDFSYNVNPPIFPIDVDYSRSNFVSNQHVGEGPHFNFFFSLGQTF